MNLRRCCAALLIVSWLGSAAAPAAEPAKAAATTTSAGDMAAMAAAALKASGLSATQLLGGTKTGLGAIIDLAAKELAKPGAVDVKTPPTMERLVSLAQRVNQSGAIDSFKSSLTAAAASVMPQTTAVLKESLASIRADDAMGLAHGAPGSATNLLRKAAEPALKAKVMPLVAQAIAANGLAAKAKDLASKAGPMAAMMGVPNATDLEGYLYSQVLETSFSYIAKGEAALRANPAQLKDATAAKVFALGKK